MAVTITEGTQTDIYTVVNAGTEIQVVKLDMGAGTTLSAFSGTVLAVTNLAGGTVTALAAGTITNGTILTLGIRHADEFATLVTSGTSTLGTIRAGVSGSAIYVTGITISVQAASNVVIGNGGTSLPILGTLFFAGSAGAAVLPIDPPLRTSSGSALVYQQSANTGMSIMAIGYID